MREAGIVTKDEDIVCKLTVPRSSEPFRNVSMETTGWMSFRANTTAKVNTQTNPGIIYSWLEYNTDVNQEIMNSCLN